MLSGAAGGSASGQFTLDQLAALDNSSPSRPITDRERDRSGTPDILRHNSNNSDKGTIVSMSNEELAYTVDHGKRASERAAAAVRAVGGGNLLVEPLAPLLAGAEHMSRVTLARRFPDDGRQVENVPVRHVTLDDMILKACLGGEGDNGKGITQVVAVNSGLQTRVYRLHLPQVNWYDIDSLEVLELKRRLTADPPAELANFSRPRCKNHLMVVLNVMTKLEKLMDALLKAKFDVAKPAVFILEGIFYSLPDEGVSMIMSVLPKHPDTLVFASAFQAKMLQSVADPANWVHTPALEAIGKGWVSSYESNVKHGAFKGWEVVPGSEVALSEAARRKGAIIPPNVWGEGEELVFALRPERPPEAGKGKNAGVKIAAAVVAGLALVTSLMGGGGKKKPPPPQNNRWGGYGY